MIKLRFLEQNCPTYMTAGSAAADLRASADLVIGPASNARVPTGVWIAGVDWDKVPKGSIPELQIRARSGLAAKYGITLMNGVGTIDADYPDEIGVLIWNTSQKDSFTIAKGDRIAQIVLNLVHRIEDLPVGDSRQGGFGSTGKV